MQGKINMLYAGVHILSAPYHIDKTYDYSIPLHLNSEIHIGSIVVVPFGGANKLRVGLVVYISPTTNVKNTKPVLGIPGGLMSINEELLGLCKFMKDRFFCTIGDAVRTVMPSGLSVNTGITFAPAGDSFDDNAYEKLNPSACEILSFIRREGKVNEKALAKKFGSSAKQCAVSLVSLGFLKKEAAITYHTNEKNEKYIRLLLSEDELSDIFNLGSKLYTEKQINVLKVLSNSPLSSLTQVLLDANVGSSVVKELVKKQAVEEIEIEKYRSPYDFDNYEKQDDFDLSLEQSEALNKLSELCFCGEAKAALLFGITGSGKTNVMLKLIDKVIERGKSVIFLVPEIALTSQTIGIFAARYQNRIAVLHSALSAGERLDTWKRVSSGNADIVIGTRSAVFAPVKNLGLIVIDEEQESSFKSEMSPKYHARDIARYRCAKNNAMMLLSSATPSVESFYKAQSGIYSLIKLENRFGNARLPEVIIHDMRSENSVEQGESDGKMTALPLMLGNTLCEEIQKNLEKQEQTILFINKRGYRSFVTCRACGQVVQCPNCSVSMTYHKHSSVPYRLCGEMMCHYCGYTEEPPKICPVCGSEHISYMGGGTQMLEESISRHFPEARVLRMDMDTTSGKLSHDAILSSFRNKEADILLGTQMVTKGHDFPSVTLVGVILADMSLYLNDFRANERTFSLITQVLGRAGRGDILGRAVIQTYSPDNITLKLCASQNYTEFYGQEISLRKAATFPPFCDIIAIGFSSETENEALNAAKAFGLRLDELAKNNYSDIKFILYGPFQAAIYKLGGRYRIKYIVKCRDNPRTRGFFSILFSEFSANSADRVMVSIDINPSNIN